MSKGSKPRPFSVSQQEYDTRWDAIFSRDLKEDTKDKVIDEVSKLVAEETLQATESK
jgi:hypothetical protein